MVFALFFLVLGMIQEPLLLLFRYPSRTMHQRTDRLAGQKIANQLYLDLRNSSSEQTWAASTPVGDVSLLALSVSGYAQADSPGHSEYRLWHYSAENHTLYRAGWTKEQLGALGLPIVDSEPTPAQWEKFLERRLPAVGYHLTRFAFTKLPSGLEVDYAIKNQRRTGDPDEYRVELSDL